MQLIRVEQIESGMRVGRTVTTADGRVLLTMGSVLKEAYVEPLLRQGLTAIYVINELAPDVVVEDVVSDESRQELKRELATLLKHVQGDFAAATRGGLSRFSAGLDVSRLSRAVDTAVEHVLANPRVVFNLKDIRTADEYTLGHSVNVCILSTLLATVMDYTPQEMKALAMGALLHDIGKTLIAPAILNKPGALTPEEIATMHQHTTLGWKILREQRMIRSTAAIVALQHHERWGGGGYPDGLKGEQIYKHSRIVAVADCFDAMTADRPYRKGMTSAQALTTLQEGMAGFFEPALLFSFTQCVAPYPVGSLVEVTGGLQAIIVSVRRGNTYLPRIRLVRDAAGAPLPEGREVELADDPQIRIVRLLEDPGAAGLSPLDLEAEA